MKEYIKFSKESRRVLCLAQKEAQRLNHNYTGAEHILLGLVRERGGGVADSALVNLGVDLNKVRSAVESVVGCGDKARYGSGDDLTPRAKKVVELAVDEARRMNRTYVGTEHLLIGLLREEDGVAVAVLESFGLFLEPVRAEVGSVYATYQKEGGLKVVEESFNMWEEKVVDYVKRNAEALPWQHSYQRNEFVVLLGDKKVTVDRDREDYEHCHRFEYILSVFTASSLSTGDSDKLLLEVSSLYTGNPIILRSIWEAANAKVNGPLLREWLVGLKVFELPSPIGGS